MILVLLLGHRVTRVILEIKELKAIKAFLATTVHLEQMVPKVILVRKVAQEVVPFANGYIIRRQLRQQEK
jgi:hypothetical protein